MGATTINPIVRYMKNSSGDIRLRYRISCGIYNPSRPKPVAPDAATVALPAGQIANRIIATMRQRERHPERHAFPNDFRFGQRKQRRLDSQSPSLNTSLGAFFHGLFKSPHELRAAIRIPRIVEHIGAEVDGLGAD